MPAKYRIVEDNHNPIYFRVRRKEKGFLETWWTLYQKFNSLEEAKEFIKRAKETDAFRERPEKILWEE